jgi:hypothetical protein
MWENNLPSSAYRFSGRGNVTDAEPNPPGLLVSKLMSEGTFSA